MLSIEQHLPKYHPFHQSQAVYSSNDSSLCLHGTFQCKVCLEEAAESQLDEQLSQIR